MPKIYRVENEEREGCYAFVEDTFKILGEHFINLEKYPEPLIDKKIKRNPLTEEICGFLNLEQSKKWFSDIELLELEKLGYYLKEVEVKKITAIGERQVLAIR